MTGRERVRRTLARESTDTFPCDFGGCSVTGMHVSVVYALRQALHLDPPGTPVKVVDPFQMLGEIDMDLRDRLHIDTVELAGTGTFFGFPRSGWKPWTTFDGTPVLVPGDFNTALEKDGRLYMYPEGDRGAAPSGVMPRGGHYFDAIQRAPRAEPDLARVEDNLEEFGPIPDAELEHLARESARLRRETDRAVFASFPGAGFGDLAWLPAPFLKHPRGVRDYGDWLMALVTHPDFVEAVFTRQCEIALNNLRLLHGAVGDGIDVLFVSGADYGSQHGPAIAPTLYADLFAPHYARINGWIHECTTWKSFVHSCGAIEPIIPHMVDAGFDAINPVQCSAAGMDPALLKCRYGGRVVFWGGGVDMQQTLPFGTPEGVRAEVAERVSVLGAGGGFVFNATHNIQPGTPVENVLALFEACLACRGAGPLT